MADFTPTKTQETGAEVLRELAKRAKERPMTPEERHQQKVSFIMGTMGKNSTITREEVERILKQRAG